MDSNVACIVPSLEMTRQGSLHWVAGAVQGDMWAGVLACLLSNASWPVLRVTGQICLPKTSQTVT